MQNYRRSDRVKEQIRRDLAELIQKELKDPRVYMISLTEVEVTPDYAHAKVYFSTLSSEDSAEIQEVLNKASNFLRRLLGHRIHLHTLPQLHFIYDTSIANGNYMNQLIQQAVEKHAEPD